MAFQKITSTCQQKTPNVPYRVGGHGRGVVRAALPLPARVRANLAAQSTLTPACAPQRIAVRRVRGCGGQRGVGEPPEQHGHAADLQRR